jgi:hypothetical protein
MGLAWLGFSTARGRSWWRSYVDAGFDEVYVSQIGDDQADFFEFYRRELAPRLS